MGYLNHKRYRELSFRLRVVYFLLLSLPVIGMVGFKWCEGWSWLDSLYMTVITLSTVGYNSVGGDLSEAGKIFNSVYIIVSFSTFAVTLTTATTYLASGEVKRFIVYRKLMKDLNSINNHVIVCGLGRVGRQAVRQLQSSSRKYVCIEQSVVTEEVEGIVLQGDATQDEILKLAGIEKATALISCLPSDADNLYVVLSARALNANLEIISRATNYEAEAKLKRAGANFVVMPDAIGGKHMASLITEPGLVTFLEQLSIDSGVDVGLHELQVPSFLTNRELVFGDLKSLPQFEGLVVAYRDLQRAMHINPKASTKLQLGAHVIIIANNGDLQVLKEFLNKS